MSMRCADRGCHADGLYRASTILEPLTESIPCGLLGAMAFRYFFGIPSWLTFLLHETAWYTLDVCVFRALTRSSPAQSLHVAYHDGPGFSGFRPAFFTAWVVRELFAFPIWAFAMLGNKVSWRVYGKIYRVRTDGKVEETPSSEGHDLIDRAGQKCFELRRRSASDDQQ